MMRLDVFLCTARIFKSRSLAAEAASSSMIFVDGLRAKPSKEIRPGSVIEIRTPAFFKKLKVVSLPPKNMKKQAASSLYNLVEERILT